MFNSEMLEVGIGLVFVYLLLCLLCAGIKEAVARVLVMAFLPFLPFLQSIPEKNLKY